MSSHIKRSASRSRSWDPVADWYAGWAGAHGSRVHRTLAVPLLMALLRPAPGEHILDLGCGAGVLAPDVVGAGAQHTGVDLSPRLLARARKAHGTKARFLKADVTRPGIHPALEPGAFDAATFLLSIQDIAPLDAAVANAARLVEPAGRVVIVMLHPCFRVPRQSGWGWDEGRALRFRRIDSYLSPLAVPMQPHGKGQRGTTRSYHRPLSAYVEALAAHGLALTAMREVTDLAAGAETRAVGRARAEFPLLLGLRCERLYPAR